MYVAVKGGEKAIDNAHRLLARKRRGDTALPELSVEQIRQQMPLAVSRVMTEGSLYDEQLAALAIKQAAGDLMEAIFLLRAYRTTLPRFAASLPLDTAGMRLQRRISATYKDLPGGQLLGPTFDYTHRLLDFSLLAEGDYPGPEVERGASLEPCPRVLGLLDREGLMTPEYELPGAVPDITREPLDFPTGRAQRLQGALGSQIATQPSRRQDIDFVFLAATPQQARQIKPTLAFQYAGDLPVYATSHLYTGTNNPTQDQDLNGIRFCETPWLLNPSDPTRQQVAAQWPQANGSMGRLYAMGVDAYRLAPRLPELKAVPSLQIDGLTGTLSLNPTQRIERQLQWAEFRNGQVQPLGTSSF